MVTRDRRWCWCTASRSTTACGTTSRRASPAITPSSRMTAADSARRPQFDNATAYTHTDDLLALLAHLGIERAALVGLSFGGGVVLKTALRAPGSVTHLVLVDAVLGGVPWDEESSRSSEAVDLAVRLGGVAAGRRAWCSHALFAPANERPDLASRLVEMVDGYPGHHWLGSDPHRPEGDERPIDVLDTIKARRR